MSFYLSSVLKHSFEAWIRHLYFLEFLACFWFVSVTPLHVLSVLYACGCLLKSQESLSLSVKVGNMGNLLLSRKRKGHLSVGYWSMFVIWETCSYFFNNTVTSAFRNHQILSEGYKKIRYISQNIISTGHIFIKVFLYVSAYCIINYRYKSIESVPYHFSEHGNLVE